MRFNFKVDAALAGMRLDHAIHKAATDAGHTLSKRAAKGLVDGGSVTLNGRVTKRASLELRHGVLVALELPAEAPTVDLVDLADRVVYRDAYILAINKPAWLATHATRDAARDHALAGVERILLAEGVKSPRVAVHHRLDVETTGVLLFGIHPDANKGLTDAFRDRLAQKTYIALVANTELPDAWTVENYLGKDTSQRRAKSIEVQSGGDHAVTDFVVLQRADVIRIQAMPHTGRMHQIRAHLASSGAPILGDVLYGGSKNLGTTRVPRVMLHAFRLELPHPVTGKPLTIEAPLPDEFLAFG
ncbi:MAG: RluA family pseudouridine synthase [bacterium]